MAWAAWLSVLCLFFFSLCTIYIFLWILWLPLWVGFYLHSSLCAKSSFKIEKLRHCLFLSIHTREAELQGSFSRDEAALFAQDHLLKPKSERFFHTGAERAMQYPTEAPQMCSRILSLCSHCILYTRKVSARWHPSCISLSAKANLRLQLWARNSVHPAPKWNIMGKGCDSLSQKNGAGCCCLTPTWDQAPSHTELCFSLERPALQPFLWLRYLRSPNKNWYMQIGHGYLLFILNIVFQLNFAFCGDAFLKTRTEHKIPLFKWHILGRYGLRNLAVTYSVCGFYFVRLCGAMNLSCP